MRRGDGSARCRCGAVAGCMRGFTFVAVMVVVAIIAVGLAVAGPLWSQRVRRDHERELLRIGVLYAQALAEYRNSSPGSQKLFPSSLDELTQDGRSLRARRYMRRLYPDPVAPGLPWGLVRDSDGRIKGVFSQSNEAPIVQRPQIVGPLVLAPAARYSDWQFVAPPSSSSSDFNSRSQ